MARTLIQKLNEEDNSIFIKRDDLIPISFGGNKVRKALLFFEDIDRGNYDSVVTYGSSSSNHCRVVANLAASRGLKCFIISPDDCVNKTYNSRLTLMLGAVYITCQVDKVQDTIENTLEQLKTEGYNPNFIPGGGHGNIGTQAYVNCYEEIRSWQNENNIQIDYIFHASGTGTTQAGLVCGKILYSGAEDIIGISIARQNPRGRQVVIDSVEDYLSNTDINISEYVTFIDTYIGGGYGKSNQEIEETINRLWTQYGIPTDETYTAKAFTGMIDYLKIQGIKGKNILFIHTGGTPLFFDYIKKV